MKKFAVVFVISLFFASMAYAESAVAPTLSSESTTQSGVVAKKYFCPMDGFTSDKPGKCEKCGMDLIEMPSETATTDVPVVAPAKAE